MRIGLPLFLYAPCALGSGVLSPAGPVGRGERLILLNSIAIMLAIVVPTVIAIACIAWWFRSSNQRARYQPQFSYSGQLELLVWSVPALVVLFLGGIAWVSSHDLDPTRPLAARQTPLDVQVISLDWKWLFIFPQQGIASVNHLVIPTGTPVHFHLTSATVMNSFFIPQLGSQIYSMAGMDTELYLQADRPGRFAGLSAQFSGDGFSDMRFSVEAMQSADFDFWVASARRQAPLTWAAYQALAADHGSVIASVYGQVADNLFTDVVHGQRNAVAPP
jgi:cytochrome o ubiquinol oxidase subunit II